MHLACHVVSFLFFFGSEPLPAALVNYLAFPFCQDHPALLASPFPSAYALDGDADRSHGVRQRRPCGYGQCPVHRLEDHSFFRYVDHTYASLGGQFVFRYSGRPEESLGPTITCHPLDSSVSPLSLAARPGRTRLRCSTMSATL